MWGYNKGSQIIDSKGALQKYQYRISVARMKNYTQFILLLEKFQCAIKGEGKEMEQSIIFEIKILRKWDPYVVENRYSWGKKKQIQLNKL